MKRIFFTCLMLTLALAQSYAQQHTAVLPSGAKLEIYLPAKSKANGRCILVTPGGAYQNLAVDGEGRQWAPWLTERGYVMAMLSYRMPHGNYEWPLQDGREAMALLRERGEAWRIKNGCIGVMGFSAGGHVASTFATKMHGDEAPAFQILFYPVITMDPSYTHANSRTNLLGSNPSQELQDLYSNEKQVADDNPPAFICYAANDNVVPIANAKNYYQALVNHSVPAYIKEYPTGGHGFGFGNNFSYQADMHHELETWLDGLKNYLHDEENFPHTQWTDVTSTYIVSPGFEDCTAYDGNVMITAGPKGNSIDYAETGWRLEQMSDWCCSAVMAYGTTHTFSTTTCTPPAADNAGNGGNALAISIGRTYQIRYVSTTEVTLPAGHYRLKAWCTNQNTDGDNYTEYHSLLGFVPNEGNAYLSSLTGLVAGRWTQDVVEFTLDKPTTGRFQVGGKGINNYKPSTEHAKAFIDNLTLEVEPPFVSLMDRAYDVVLPEANVGDAAFQYPAEPIVQFTRALNLAEEAYQQFMDGEEVDLDAASTSLSEAIEAYNAVKDAVNPPAEGCRYKLTSTFDWETWNAQLSGLTGGVLTLGLHATQAVPGTYVLALGPSSDKSYGDEPYLAQAFQFTPVEGVPGGFTMSITDEEGLTRYVCSGSQYSGGNSLQVRTTTDASKALTLRIIPSNTEEGVMSLRSTASGINLSFKDYVVYCWSEMTNRSDGFRIEEVTEPATVGVTLAKGQYTTCVFPFALTVGGQSLNEVFAGLADKVEVYACYGIDADGKTLVLTPTTELMANTPYVLKAVNDCEFNISGYGTALAPNYTSGWLVGNYATNATIPVGCYKLETLPEDGQGFTLVGEDTEDCHIDPYAAYLEVPETMTDAPVVIFLPSTKDDDDPATGIEEVKSGELKVKMDAMYDLNGRRLSTPVPGFFIVRRTDGKAKVIMKSEK